MTQGINRKLADLLFSKTWQGIVPNFCSDPRLVIEAMREREDWREFYIWASDHGRALDYNSQGTVFIRMSIAMDKTGKLAKLATEWLKEKEK